MSIQIKDILALPPNQNSDERHSGIDSEPELKGYFSIDKDGHLLPDSSSLLYCNLPDKPEVNLDLNDGIESGVCTNHFEDYHLLCKWISMNRQTLQRNNEWVQPDFVCTRGLLTKLLCTPYLPGEGWVIRAAKFNGTIHMRVDEKLVSFDGTSEERLKTTSYWGYKFEQYVLSDSPHQSPDTSRPVVEARGIRGIYQRRIGDHSVLYSAVMNAVRSKTVLRDPLPLNSLEFVETRTTRMIEHEGHQRTFRKYKLLKWWAHGFLTNVDTLLCGFRDDNGIVHKIKNYRLDEMIGMSRTYWKPERCKNFIANFLKKVSEIVVDDCTEASYRIERVPGEDSITFVKLPPTPQNAVIPTQLFKETG